MGEHNHHVLTADVWVMEDQPAFGLRSLRGLKAPSA
jgi:hypothetical protein